MGQKTGDAVNFVANSTKLAKAGFAEAGQSLDLLTTIMNAYGLEAKDVTKVSDILINTQNLGKVTVGELSQSMGKVIPTAKAYGINLEQVASGYAIMTAKGIKSAETTTYMASMFNELGKSGTKASDTVKEISGKSFQDLIKSGKTVGDVLAMMDDYAKKNNLSLADLFGSAEAGKASLILSANAGKDFNEMLKSMNNTAGATDEAFKKVTNTTGERFRKSLNQLKNDAIKLGDSIAPLMDKLSSAISTIADKLNGLSKEQLDSIAKWGTFAIASGGALKILGGGISTIGNIAGGLSKLTGFLGKATTATKSAEAAIGLATKGFSAMGLATKASTILLNPWALAIAGVGIAGVATAKYLKKDAVPAVDLFADKVEYSTKQVTDNYGNMTTQVESNTIKISKATKDAVGAYIKMDDDVSKTLTDLYVTSAKITGDNTKSLIDKYNSMNTQIKDGMDKHYSNQEKTMKDFFATSNALTDKEEADALKTLKESNEDKKRENDEYVKKIQTILEKASKDKRELNSQEQKEINAIQEKMKTNAVKSLSDSEVESKVILERLKGYSERITAEQASEVIKNAEKQRQESVNAAEKQYDETVANIVRMRDESHAITKDQADKLIADAERQKKESITKAGEMKDEVVQKIKEMNADTLKNIDENDGHIMSKWEKLKGWFTDNPITRWIKTKTDDSDSEPGHKWTGTNYWQGGLTYLHDAPGRNTNYELYDLPRGTRIYNHDASEDLVLQTAESVATKVAGSILNNSNGKGKIEVIQHIYCPVPTPSELARQTKNNLKELGLQW